MVLTQEWYVMNLSKQLLVSYFAPISETIQVRRIIHIECGWRIKDEFKCDVFLKTSMRWSASIMRLARTYIHLLSAKTVYSLEVLPRVMENKNTWSERPREFHAVNVIWDITVGWVTGGCSSFHKSLHQIVA